MRAMRGANVPRQTVRAGGTSAGQHKGSCLPRGLWVAVGPQSGGASGQGDQQSCFRWV